MCAAYLHPLDLSWFADVNSPRSIMPQLSVCGIGGWISWHYNMILILYLALLPIHMNQISFKWPIVCRCSWNYIRYKQIHKSDPVTGRTLLPSHAHCVPERNRPPYRVTSVITWLQRIQHAFRRPPESDILQSRGWPVHYGIYLFRRENNTGSHDSRENLRRSCESRKH